MEKFTQEYFPSGILIRPIVVLVWQYFNSVGFFACCSCELLVFPYSIRWCGKFHKEKEVPCPTCRKQSNANLVTSGLSSKEIEMYSQVPETKQLRKRGSIQCHHCT